MHVIGSRCPWPFKQHMGEQGASRVQAVHAVLAVGQPQLMSLLADGEELREAGSAVIVQQLLAGYYLGFARRVLQPYMQQPVPVRHGPQLVRPRLHHIVYAAHHGPLPGPQAAHALQAVRIVVQPFALSPYPQQAAVCRRHDVEHHVVS